MKYTKLVLLIMVLDLAIDCGNAMHVFPGKSDSVISMCNINTAYPNPSSNKIKLSKINSKDVSNEDCFNLESNNICGSSCDINNMNSHNIYTACNNSTAENTEDYQKNNLNDNKAGVKKLNNNGQKIKKPIENNVNCRDSGINIGIRNSISKHDSDTQLDNNEAFSYNNSAMKLVTMPPVRNEIDDMSQNTTLMTSNTDGILCKDISENDNSILLIQDEKNDKNILLSKIGNNNIQPKISNNHNNNTRQLNNIFQYFRNSPVLANLAKLKHRLLNNAKGKNNSAKKIINKNVNSKWNQHYKKESIKKEFIKLEEKNDINNQADVKLVPYINNDTDGINNITIESAQYENDNIKDSINANMKKCNNRIIKLPAYVNNNIDKNSKNFKTIMFNQLTNKTLEKLYQKNFKKLADKAIEAQNKQEIKQIVNKIKDNKYDELVQTSFKKLVDKAIEAQNKKEIKQIVNKIKDNKYNELVQTSFKKLVDKAVENQNKQEIKKIINAIKDKKQEELAQNKLKRYVDNFAYPRLKNMFDAVKDHKANELAKKSIREIQRIFENQQLNIGFCANVISKKINNIQKKAVRPSRSITELGEYYRKLVPLDNFKDIEEFVNDFIKNCHLVYRDKTCWYNKKYKEFCKYIDANNSFKLDINTIKKLSETLKKLLGLCSDDDAEMFERDFNDQKNIDIDNYYTECIQSQIDHYENTDTPYNIGTKTEISNMKDYFIQLQVNQQNMIDKQQIIELFKNKIDFTSTRYVVHEDENGKKKSVLTTDNSIESHILHLIAICKHWKEVYDKYHNLYDFLQKVEQQSLSKKNNIVLN